METKTEYKKTAMISQTAQGGKVDLKDYFSSLKKSLKQKRVEFEEKRKYTHIKFDDFKEMFVLFASAKLLKKKQNKDFVIDAKNENAIFQLYAYISGNSNFTGDFHKGIMIVGNIGTGKTLIMDTFLDICKITIFKENAHKFIRIHSKEVSEKLKQAETDKRIYFNFLFVDDIGKESKTSNNFGTISNPVSDLFSARYDNSALTFATANYSKDSFSKFYGDTISDRFVEMFNIVKLDGDNSRRKQKPISEFYNDLSDNDKGDLPF